MEEAILKPITGNRLAYIREALSYSQAEIARKIGVSQSTICRWEGRDELVVKPATVRIMYFGLIQKQIDNLQELLAWVK